MGQGHHVRRQERRRPAHGGRGVPGREWLPRGRYRRVFRADAADDRDGGDAAHRAAAAQARDQCPVRSQTGQSEIQQYAAPSVAGWLVGEGLLGSERHAVGAGADDLRQLIGFGRGLRQGPGSRHKGDKRYAGSEASLGQQ